MVEVDLYHFSLYFCFSDINKTFYKIWFLLLKLVFHQCNTAYPYVPRPRDTHSRERMLEVLYIYLILDFLIRNNYCHGTSSKRLD